MALSLSDGKKNKLWSYQDGDLRDVAASADGKIAFAYRSIKSEYYELGYLNAQHRMYGCEFAMGDVRTPSWIGPRGAVSFIAERESVASLYQSVDCNVTKPTSPANVPGIRIQNDGFPRSQLVLFESRTDGPPILMSSKPPLVRGGVADSLRPKQINIPLNGGTAKAWFWPAAPMSRRTGVTIFVHGGPHLNETAEWEPLKRGLQKAGQIVVALNYTGSSGYGRTYERRARLDQVARELIETCKYLTARENISPTEVTVVAASYGTSVLLQALVRQPTMCGLIVLYPFLPDPSDLDRARDIPFRGTVIAFHGLQDPISAAASAPIAVSSQDRRWKGRIE
jgi:dienelactone hydrolase